MTFTEAAAQVLRLVGKPLHYKEITDVAIEKNLLSHVGKSPEVTMGARLAALVKKGEKDNPLIRIRPGVFALRDWDQATIDAGLADRTPALERLVANAEELGQGPEEAVEEEATEAPAPPLKLVGSDDEEEEEAKPPDDEELRRAQIAAGASELYDAEEDDDVPIFGEGSEDEAEEEASSRDTGRRRRRRRRRSRGGDDERGGDDLPSYTVSEAPPDLALSGGGSGGPSGAGSASVARDGARQEPREVRNESRASEAQRDTRRSAGKAENLAGSELSRALADVLAGFDRSRGPVAAQTVLEAAQRRGVWSGELPGGVGTLIATARADNLRAQLQGTRARFRVSGTRLALTDWLLDSDISRLERELSSVATRYREATRRVLLQRLQELPHRALSELTLALFDECGFDDFRVVRRQGALGSELHLSARSKGAGEARTAIVLRRDGKEIGRERVTEVRGALHHYGPAHAAWLITTGQVLSGAREEASAPGAAPVQLTDGMALSRLCEEHHVGLVTQRIDLPLLDADLFETLAP